MDRAEILSQIRRLAEMNGGVPLGRRRLPGEEVLRQLALAVRDLVRFPPTRAEMKMRRRNVNGFPSPNVIERYGRKADQIEALRASCEEVEGFGDVTESLPARSEGPASPREEPAIVTGVVHLMKMGRYYKIGRSNSPGRREYEIALQMPERVETVHVIETDDPRGIERYWHSRFAENRANGEWFQLSRSDIAAFRRRSYM